MSTVHRPSRILALHLGTREIGFALLDGETLVRYGVRNIKDRRDKEKSGKVPATDLIQKYSSDFVILGKLAHPERKKNPLLKNLTSQMKKFAIKKGIEVKEIGPTDARKDLIQEVRPTKMNAAKLIAAEYPELLSYLPQRGRILWTYREKYWMNMFDALTLGLYYIRKHRKDVAQNENFKCKRK